MRYILVLALLASTASAEPAKYKRSAITIPTVRPRAEKPRHVDAATPALTATQILASHLDLQPLRREQELLLERLVRDTPEADSEKPDYMFRLAEQYAKQHRVWRLRAVKMLPLALCSPVTTHAHWSM